MTQLSDDLRTLWTAKGLPVQEMVNWLLCDRSPDGGFAVSYVVLTRRGLYFIHSTKPQTVREKHFKGYVVPEKEIGYNRGQLQAEDYEVRLVKLEVIERLTVVNLVASGMLVMRERGSQERLAGIFTNSQMEAAARLVSSFEKLKQGQFVGGRGGARKDAACPNCGMLYPARAEQICPRCMKKYAIFRRLLGLTGKYKGTIALIVLFMLLNAVTNLVIPYLSGAVLFDQALGGNGRFAGQIGLVILLIIVFRTLSLLFGIVFGIQNAKLAANVAFDLKADVFESLQRLSLAFFQKRQTGQLMTRVNNDAADVQYFFTDGISYFIVNAMNIIGIVAILFALDWRLTLLCLVPLPLMMFIIRSVFPKLWRLSWRRHRRISAMNALISDSIRGARVVKAFGKEHLEIGRFAQSSRRYADAEQRFNRMGSAVFPLLNMVIQAGGVIVWAVGGWQVIQGNFTFGLIMSFLHYLTMLYNPIQFMNQIVNWWSNCMSAAQRIFEIQDAVPDIQEKKDAVDRERIDGEIRVSNVTFGYEPNRPVLKNVSIHVKPGQMVGVVGRSGAGKSTLVNLISRLYDPTEGSILIDGIDVRDYRIDTLRRNIGIVSQEVFIFMGTIAENIAYANPECTLEEIVRAAKIANAHDFISKLPDGYDTVVGANGHDLSGGEKQRISIARAVLHDPKILILDEATASQDTQTELAVQEALEKLMKGRTTIAIAHRLSTLRHADSLIVIDKGEVVEAGTHEQLMEKTNGVYAGLVRKHDEALKMTEVI